MHLSIDRVRVSWNSPSCNGAPVRGVRIITVDISRNLTKLFQTNQTNWNDKSDDAFVILEDYQFFLNVTYVWEVAVQYDYRDGRTWSQYGVINETYLGGRFLLSSHLLRLPLLRSFACFPFHSLTSLIDFARSFVRSFVHLFITSFVRPSVRSSVRSFVLSSFV